MPKRVGQMAAHTISAVLAASLLLISSAVVADTGGGHGGGHSGGHGGSHGASHAASHAGLSGGHMGHRGPSTHVGRDRHPGGSDHRSSLHATHSLHHPNDLHHGQQHHGALVFGARARSAFGSYSYDCYPHSAYFSLARCRASGTSFYGYGRYGYEWAPYTYGLGPLYGLGARIGYSNDSPFMAPEVALGPQGDPIEHRQSAAASMRIPLVASSVPPDVLSNSTPEHHEPVPNETAELED